MHSLLCVEVHNCPNLRLLPHIEFFEILHTWHIIRVGLHSSMHEACSHMHQNTQTQVIVHQSSTIPWHSSRTQDKHKAWGQSHYDTARPKHNQPRTHRFTCNKNAIANWRPAKSFLRPWAGVEPAMHPNVPRWVHSFVDFIRFCDYFVSFYLPAIIFVLQFLLSDLQHIRNVCAAMNLKARQSIQHDVRCCNCQPSLEASSVNIDTSVHLQLSQPGTRSFYSLGPPPPNRPGGKTIFFWLVFFFTKIQLCAPSWHP